MNNNTFITFVILLATVNGYIFSRTWLVTRFRILQSQGYALHYISGYMAFFYTLFCFLFCSFLFDRIDKISEICRDFFSIVCPVKLSGTKQELIIGLIFFTCLSYPLARLLNYLTPEKYKEKISYRTLHNLEFEKLLWNAVKEFRLVLLSLENGREYAGWVILSVSKNRDDTIIRLLPLLSGYRDSSNHKVEFTTNYGIVYNKITEQQSNDNEENSIGANNVFYDVRVEDFEITIPVHRIITARLFELDVYDYFQNPNPIQLLNK